MSSMPEGVATAPERPYFSKDADTAGASSPGPWRAAGRRMLASRSAVVASLVLIGIVGACMAAPLYARYVAHSGPNANHISEVLHEGRAAVPVLSAGGVSTTVGGQLKLRPGGVPVGPQFLAAGGRFLLGADGNGRDVAVRLLYGGRNSLTIGFAATLITVVVAVPLALLAAYFGGVVDGVISRALDAMWAFPVLLLGVSLGTALALNGFNQFGIHISSMSLLIPIFILSLAPIPYVARPLRAQALSLRRREFVDAAIAAGARPGRIMFRELLPNLASTVLVMSALNMANVIIFEASLSYLGAGVQPPTPSWGTLIADGQALVLTAPWLSVLPGLAMFLTALSLNILGGGLRDALDPKATVRGRWRF